jgi:hypothetical protein
LIVTGPDASSDALRPSRRLQNVYEPAARISVPGPRPAARHVDDVVRPRRRVLRAVVDRTVRFGPLQLPGARLGKPHADLRFATTGIATGVRRTAL